MNIDFEKTATEWDWIYLSSDGFKACSEPCIETLRRYFSDDNIRPSLKAWDIPSFLVFNPDILILVKEQKNDRYIEM